MKEKVKKLLKKLPSIERALGDCQISQDQENFRKLSKEHSYLIELKGVWERFEKTQLDLKNSLELLEKEESCDFIQIIREEILSLEKTLEDLKQALEILLVPPSSTDDANVIMELRAGTGGDEAALFVSDCVRMYRLYADKMGWRAETLASTNSKIGGYKEYILSLTGKNVYRFLKYEAGTHRVQRVPLTETQGRLHTSAITVAILMEPTQEEQISIDEKDLKIDTYRASGAGGQHVNTTDSAVRITHIPTGVVVYCQEERSQHKNKSKALRVLGARLAEEEKKKKEKERATLRQIQVGSGDRSERIRTYNFSQNRLTDHRIQLTLYKLDQVMEGDLKEVSEALMRRDYEERLKSDGFDA